MIHTLGSTRSGKLLPSVGALWMYPQLHLVVEGKAVSLAGYGALKLVWV